MANFFKEWKAQRAAEKQIDLGTYYKFDPPPEWSNKHYLMAEELLIPMANRTDGQREQMFASHTAQTVHLVKSEYPKVFTNFENQFGEYSIGYKKADDDFIIIDKFQKNALNYDLLVKYTKTGVYDIIHYRRAEHITEEYGYGKIDCLQDKVVGDTVRAGDFLYKTPNYDDDGNFGYGVNLKAAFVAWKGLTYEDSIVISKSAAEKLTSYKCEETFVSINGNDVLLNLYDNGEYKQYHSFPHVGEHTLDNILVALRREEGQTLLYNFQYDKMKKIQPSDDITYTNGGIVADMDIYCNTSIEKLKQRNNEFNQEIISLLEQQNIYYKNAAEALEKIVPCATEADMRAVLSPDELANYYAERKEYGFNWTRPKPQQLLDLAGIKYTEEFGYFWKQVHEYLDNRIQWRSKGKSFQNIKIKFTILKENKLSIGSKLSGRYGNKGIVALVEHDSKLPKLPDGSHVDICLNTLGVINRMNLSQLYEQFINFTSDHVVKIMKNTIDPLEKIDIYLAYLKYVDKEQYNFFDLELMTMNRAQKVEFIKEVEEKGIYVHQSPFFGNIEYESLKRMTQDHPEWCTPYQCEGIETPLVVGDIYFIRLIISRLALIDGEFLRALFTK